MPACETTLRVGVVNPTTLNNNAWKFAKLSFDLALVSETSVTQVMQQPCAKALNDFGFRTIWGAPVPAARVCLNGQDSLKGMALGVCLIASKSIAVRPSRDDLPQTWKSTCRLMVSYVQLPTFTARVITVYGVPSCSSGAAHKNLTIWTAILGLLQSSDMPTIVGGDFNVRPETLEVWESISVVESLVRCPVVIPLHRRCSMTPLTDVSVRLVLSLSPLMMPVSLRSTISWGWDVHSLSAKKRRFPVFTDVCLCLLLLANHPGMLDMEPLNLGLRSFG